MNTINGTVVVLLFAAIMSCPFASSAQAAEKTAVIVVDMQGDFTQWKDGSLAVAGSDKAFCDAVQAATKKLSARGYPIYGTQDWHPADHVSFYTNHEGKKPFEMISINGRDQVLWPPHCVQGTENARVLVDNNLFLAIVKKGKDKRFDSYSGFQDDGGAQTEMNSILQRNTIQKVIVYGIATDYCVKATAMDAEKAGYDVVVVTELCRGVAPETTEQALKDMKDQGIRLVASIAELD